VLLFAVLVTSACTTLQLRPDRAMLLEHSAREESELLERVVLYDDPALLEYLGELGRRLAASGRASVSHHELSVHVVRDPTLALFTTPNSVIVVHTGLLAAMDDEAQLVAALAHGLAQMDAALYAADPERVKPRLDGDVPGSRTASAIFARDLALTARAALTGYGRSWERSADTRALIGMAALGWDRREGPVMFHRLAEWSAEAGPREVFLFGNRRWLAAREESMRSILGQLGASTSGSVTSAEFERVLRPLVRDNAYEDLRQGRFALARRQLDRVAAATPDDPRLHLYYGELYRLQAQRAASDAERTVELVQARAAYERALALDPTLAEAHRQLGLLYYAMRDVERARAELELYLAMAPTAPDRARVSEYVQELTR
jgi:beta-barrel assembly-enhancing protease